MPDPGVEVWIARDDDGGWAAYTAKPQLWAGIWSTDDGRAFMLDYGLPINLEPGECKRFRLVPVPGGDSDG